MIDINELRAVIKEICWPTSPLTVDELNELLDRLEAAERAVTEAYQRGYATGQEESEKERDVLRAKIEQMERQAPAYWVPKHAIEGGSTTVIVGKFPVNPTDAPLYALPGAQPAQMVVAYLDLGATGYMDIGTDLTAEALSALPKGRHMLGIVGTYGVEGYIQAQPAPSVPDEEAAYSSWFHGEQGVAYDGMWAFARAAWMARAALSAAPKTEGE